MFYSITQIKNKSKIKGVSFAINLRAESVAMLTLTK